MRDGTIIHRRALAGRVALLCLLALVAAPAPAAPKVTVFAAASLSDVLEKIAQIYPGEVVVSASGSGTIARQIAQGAPADAVILANAEWMDWLEAEGHVAAGARVDLLGNRLVLIAPAGTPDLPETSAASLIARLGGGRLAIGQTEGVPAGIYGREWLEAAGLWDALRPHLAQTDNVRAVLALVARGEAPLGIVYATDAVAEPSVRVLHEVGQALHSPIVYPAAALTPAGADFIAFLDQEAARAIFVEAGFLPPAGAR
ncbi:molybdate ABC transporter substrate-binding protein [Roseovarius aquimarinus]|uniref:Molybdate ABC transporter substrate-binding protein n=1 Tax=Roseovarius aquimarinus TaxID=1229156 RepID=A0ABW7I765_9RHOB